MFVEIIFLSLGYIFGSIPVGFLIGKFGYGIDVRKHGSGNIGMANVMRLCGKRAGIATMVLDMVKGTVPVVSARIYVWFGNYTGFGKIGTVELNDVGLLLSLIAFFAIVGHSHPVWLKFKGGKSASVGAGALLGISPIAFILVMLVWAIALKITRYTSLSNMIAGVLYPPLFWIFAGNDPFFNKSWWGGGIGLICLLFVLWRHRVNIRSLIKGTERKIGEKAKIEQKE
ncbi:MAG: glycerol-3-phosphate 1-O-acyltransferase PlsY [Candidatus Heimdallarchaeaceae archaeon]